MANARQCDQCGEFSTHTDDWFHVTGDLRTSPPDFSRPKRTPQDFCRAECLAAAAQAHAAYEEERRGDTDAWLGREPAESGAVYLAAFNAEADRRRREREAADAVAAAQQ